MAITSNATVWKLLALIFLGLTGIVAVLFYFKNIFVTFVIGGVLLVIAESLFAVFKRSISFLGLSKQAQKAIGAGILLAFFGTMVYLFVLSAQELGTALVDVESENILALYKQQGAAYVPDLVQEMVDFDEAIRTVSSYVFGVMSSMLSSLSFIMFNGFLIIPLMFYMYVKRREAPLEPIYRFFPRKTHSNVLMAMEGIREQLYEYVYAKVIESSVIAGICCIGFFLSGLKGWLILGVLAGILNIIPYIGPILGAISPILVGLLLSPKIALFVLITVIIAQLVDNFYLIPFMISGKMKMEALLSIVLILVGAQLYGPLGMVFAIPIYCVYSIVLTEAYTALCKVYK